MPHIHEKIDFAVCVFVVHSGRVLLVHHKQLNRWLPVGGHVELDEDPEQAAIRETREECGLEIALLGTRQPCLSPNSKPLIAPRFMDIHRISDTHQHVGLIYFATASSDATRLATNEHLDIRWCAPTELDTLDPPLDPAIRWYCLKAITEAQAPTTGQAGKQQPD